MEKPSQSEQIDPRYVGDGRPNYIMPKETYPSYSDMANEPPNEPLFLTQRYNEYR